MSVSESGNSKPVPYCGLDYLFSCWIYGKMWWMFSTLLVYFMGQCVFWHDSAKNNCGKGHQESSLIFFFVDTIKMVKGQQQLTSCCCSASRCNRRAVKTSRKPFMMGKKPFCPMILEERRKCVPPSFHHLAYLWVNSLTYTHIEAGFISTSPIWNHTVTRNKDPFVINGRGALSPSE